MLHSYKKHGALAGTAVDEGGSSVPVDRSISKPPAQELRGKRAAMVVFSYYQFDPRPRRAAEALARQGMEVDLIGLRGSQDPKLMTLNGVSVRGVAIRRERGGATRYLYQYVAFLLTTATILAFRSVTRRYDLIYVNNMPDFLVFCALIPKALGAKVILDLHDPVPELMRTIFDVPEQARRVRVFKWIERWSMKYAHSIITVNRACARLFASRSAPADKITVVMNTPDESIFGVRESGVTGGSGTAERRFVVMYHGSMVERNGLDLALEAFAIARKKIPSAEFRIYGSRNSFLDAVMGSARERGLEGAVRYFGEKTVDQIALAIAECDLGIIPNRQNIFTEINTPTRIFEYLSGGKAVIAPRAPGITDYFDERSLLFFELGNVEDLARQIEYVFSQPDAVRSLIARGQEVHRAHTWSQERLKLTRLVAELLSDHRVSVVPAPTESMARRLEGD